MKTAGYVILTIEYRQEKGCWTARCPELGTSTFGDCFEEAQEAIIEAIGLHLNGLEKVGERQRFFKKHGIKLYRVRPSRQTQIKIAPNEKIAYQRVIKPVLQSASV